MCNPPFYSSDEEIKEHREMKQEEPFGTCTGDAGEMICEGGEVQFVTQMINESVKRRKQIDWFSSMIGMFSHVHELKKVLDGLDFEIDSRIDTYRQGYTSRWILSWKFTNHKRIKT
jgi:23S rRNA (adenine1618-N6)-methyltransferase